jgi:hypothetical protein
MRRAILVACTSALMFGCAGQIIADEDAGNHPDGGTVTAWDGSAPGSINTAAAKYPDVDRFWTLSIERTCGPNNGVCHNSRQFPDMQTSANFLDTINTRCNQIRDQPSQIDNLCEPLGDELHIGSFVTHVGNVSAGTTIADGGLGSLVVTLKDPIPTGSSGSMSIVRPIAGLPTFTLAIPSTAIQAAAAGAKQVTLSYPALVATTAPGGTLASFLYPAQWTPGNDAQVVMGDPNGDGIFGADLGGALVKPGKPMKSYLFLRALSPIALGTGQMNTNVSVSSSNEAQMPMANLQYWDAQNDLIALWCWISGLAPDSSKATAPIDYAHCDLTQMPAVTIQGGEATTYSQIWSSILQPTCSPCHHTGTTYATRLYMDDPLETYDFLMGIAGTGPSENTLGLPYVTKSDPTKSYLYLKITGDPSITGARMPLGGQLSQSAIDSIATWITQGAYNN